MTSSEVAKSDDLIRGKCILKDKLVDVLFDSGATHSFVSLDYVSCLEIFVSSLPYTIVVSTPINQPVVTLHACLGCSVIIHGRNFLVDLICLPLSQLDVVLGMKWLSSNHVFLDYKEKTLIFGDSVPRTPRLLCEDDSRNMVNVKAFMILFSTEVERSVKAEHILVVNEFLEIFPKDVTELPLKREIEFTIDLIPGVSLVSIVPYRMLLMELAKVKSKLRICWKNNL
ncbi:uncharacterized protein LOC113862252 [Abrus precatorius]|uniref:Uncharacterized protein LOC113862252 n=1 Tax=Abrus precatorius TaxID=3816 RepID=A0A8B8L6Z2_ABRPR|nr:uncharacterized protein LOC113862252 [Abrus precatorius]